MKVFCKYCRFYDPAGWLCGNLELGEGPVHVFARCEFGEATETEEINPPIYHPELGLEKKRVVNINKITLGSNDNFDCSYYWKKWWIWQKAINRRERL
ncbi:hypothetical protein LCGC14_2751170 [marine sediment metagenome]|uniref:Uncharacterized protein n=1 Tax=marine sediment metagenome TaxID=412755 RepID=A0A0F8Z1L3_9ZZZZ